MRIVTNFKHIFVKKFNWENKTAANRSKHTCQ